jgi:hypothetical protein
MVYFPNYVRRNYMGASLLMKANLDLWNRAARFGVLLILNSRDTILPKGKDQARYESAVIFPG